MCLLDLAKGFDTVNHNLLKTNLTHQEKYVNVEGIISDKLIVECGAHAPIPHWSLDQYFS